MTTLTPWREVQKLWKQKTGEELGTTTLWKIEKQAYEKIHDRLLDDEELFTQWMDMQI